MMKQGQNTAWQSLGESVNATYLSISDGENVSPVSTEIQGLALGSVPPVGRRRKLWFATTIKGVVRHYFRPPPGMQLPDDVPNRLPDDPAEAEARAEELRALCVPFGLVRSRGRNGAIEALTLEGLARAKKRAAVKEITFDLKPEDVIRTLRKQQYRCALSGLPFKTEAVGGGEGPWRAPMRPSLDRINSNLGYLPGNVRIVLVAVNVALSDWGEDVLITIAHAISDRRRRMEGAL